MTQDTTPRVTLADALTFARLYWRDILAVLCAFACLPVWAVLVWSI